MNRENYNRIAPVWDASRVSFQGRERACLDTLLEALPLSSEVLDLGCGTGRPIAEHILSMGHHVTGVDQAESLLCLARARFAGATWINESIEAYNSSRKFDAIVCWDALFHINRSKHESIFEKCAGMLASGGKLMLTCGGSDNPAFTDTMYGETFFYDSHPPETTLTMLGEIGFKPIISEFLNLPTPSRDKGRYAIVARIT